MVEGNGKPLDKEANERLNVINHSFFKFFQIYQVIKNRKKVQTENGLMNAMKNLFITIKQAKFESCLNLTPYLHTLVHHTTEFLDKYKDKILHTGKYLNVIREMGRDIIYTSGLYDQQRHNLELGIQPLQN